MRAGANTAIPRLAAGRSRTIHSTQTGRSSGEGDFNGDHSADLVWRRGDGVTEVQLLSCAAGTGGFVKGIGGGIITNNPFDLGWSVVASGDFNGDGKTDLVWQRQSDGVAEIQLLNSAAGAGGFVTGIGGGAISNSPFDASWRVVGAADFSGDGKADLVWERKSDNLVEIQYVSASAGSGVREGHWRWRDCRQSF